MHTLGNVPLILRRALVVVAGIVLVGLAGCTDKPVPTGADPTAGPEWLSTPFRLEPLDVIACKYGGTWPNCNLAPAPSGPAAPTSPAGPTVGNEGTSAGGEGGSGTTPTPPDSVSPDTCRTGNPMIDSRDFQRGLDSLWKASNYDPSIPQTQRIEQGGWIIDNGNGTFSIRPFPSHWLFRPCEIVFPPATVVPWNAVGIVHTHPFKRGERLTACPGVVIQGVSVPITYRGDPSTDDDLMITDMRQARPNAIGVMIDADGIVTFTGQQTAGHVQRFARCGY